jgi:PAS domain S-box-containing protein/TyrR family helix-turn-helix protein
LKIKEFIKGELIWLTEDVSVREAVKIFVDNKIDGAPVVDHDFRLQGLFTKSHVYRAIDQDLDLQTSVGELMTRGDFIVGHPEDDIDNVIYPGLGRLPVVDDQGRVIALITRTDLAGVFYNSYQILASELDTIIDSTHNMIIATDCQARIKVFNRAAERILEKKREEVLGRPIVDVVPNSGLPDTIKTGAEQPVQKIVLNGRNFISNRSPIKKDGEIIGAVAVLHDISELEQISQELKYVKELNEELDAIIESSFDGLYITDGDGKTLRANKAFEMIMGISLQEFLGRNVEDIQKEGIVSESVSFLALKKRKPVTIIQEAKTGKITLATGSPVYDKNGNIFRVVCNVRDITELNLLRQRLEQAEGLSQHYESQLRTLKLQFIGSSNMIINSSSMRDILEVVNRLSQVDSTTMITGESGTGKELIAETIHSYSSRKDEPFIRVNCGAIPENLLESELFGYEYGAFSGARQEGKPGFFELAHGGTLFLDEIGELPLNLQVKLLRAIQSKEIMRVGGEAVKKIDVRIIAATNRNLADMVKAKEFREDLYYRLNVVPLNVPPLRDRREDIPPLITHFVQIFNRKYNMNKRVAAEVIDLFMGYNWPGNVRELENLIERMIVVTPDDIISKEDLPFQFDKNALDHSSQVLVRGVIPLREAVESTERQLLERAYNNYRTTRQMAGALKVNASTIVRKAAKYGLKVKE